MNNSRQNTKVRANTQRFIMTIDFTPFVLSLAVSVL